jgi:tetratricopeptide (TPR) repeat protein
VKDSSILWDNNQELDMLIRDGKNAEALKKSTAYVQKDVDLRAKTQQEYAGRGISVPLEAQDLANQTTIQLFLLRASAQMNLEKFDDAVVSYNNALKMSPMAADVLALRGWAKLESGDKKGAKKDFEASLKYLPDNESATEGLAELKAD